MISSQRVPAAVALGALFNPLNSSMIAVALVNVEQDFGVGIGAVTWLASGFYLTAVLAPPLMGALADRFGPRRIFCLGLVVVAVTGALAALAPSFPALVVIRLLQAFGTCATMPAGMAIVRVTVPGEDGRPPPRVIAMISMVLTASAAAGPVVGGFLVSLWDWRATFLVNVPLALAALVLALRWLPKVPGGGARRAGRTRPRPALLGVYAGYALVNVVFYLAFFVVPLWSQRVAGLGAGVAGLLVLPMAALAIVVTPLAVVLAARMGMRVVLLASAVLLSAGALALVFAGQAAALLVASALLGLATAFSQFSLNSLVFVHADRKDTGVAVGLFQASRFVGAAIAAGLTGLLFDAAGLVGSGVAMLVVCAAVLALSLVLPVKTSDEDSGEGP